AAFSGAASAAALASEIAAISANVCFISKTSNSAPAPAGGRRESSLDAAAGSAVAASGMVRRAGAALGGRSSPHERHSYLLLSVLLCAALRVLGVGDECCDVIVQLLQGGDVGVHHVPGLVVVILDVRLQLARHRQVLHLVHALVEGRCDVEISAVQHDLEVWVVLHRVSEVRHDVERLWQGERDPGSLMLVVPSAEEPDRWLVAHSHAVTQPIANVVVEG